MDPLLASSRNKVLAIFLFLVVSDISPASNSLFNNDLLCSSLFQEPARFKEDKDEKSLYLTSRSLCLVI